MRNNIFTNHAKEDRPLSQHLWRHARDLLNNASNASTEQGLAPFVGDELSVTISAHRLATPSLGSLAPARTGPGADRTLDTGGRISTTRIFYGIQVHGEASVLEWWPDEKGAELRSANQSLIDEIGNPRDASDADAKRYFATIDIWSIVDLSEHGSPGMFLVTFEDLTHDEIADDAAVSRVKETLKARHAEAELIVAAIETQMEEFYNVTLPHELRERAGRRRKHLENLGGLFETLGLPEEWKMQPPTVIEVAEPVEGLKVHSRFRLDPVSYEDIQRTVRLWAHSVEDDPEAFTGLREDHMSSLLAATLNATSSGAGREVYSRGGKTDIRIRADIHGEEKGPAPIFVLEAKWVSGNEDISSAIQDQLMRYVPVSATSTLLLALSRNRNFPSAVTSIRTWARAISGYQGESDGAVEGWPVFKYRVAELDDLEIDVCIATVSLAPIPPTRARKAIDSPAAD